VAKNRDQSFSLRNFVKTSTLQTFMKPFYSFQYIFLCSLLVLLTGSISYAQKPARPVPIIFDTDMGPDYDDVGAITLLHALADSGQANILATVASTTYPRVAQVLSLFNTYFGRPAIQVGVPKGHAVADADWQHWSDTIVARYPHVIKSNEAAAGAVEVYRKVLAAQPDGSVTIVTVGFLTNLSDLLKSGPDKYSKLSGAELAKRKVKHLVSMAGKFPSGKEFNVFKDAPSAKYVFDHWPTQIIFSGFEIGEKVITGLPLVQNKSIQNSPAKDVYHICLPKAEEDKLGRKSWDQTAVLVAIKGVAPYYELKPGRIITENDGSNRWDDTQTGHFYLVEKMPIAQVTGLINSLMMHEPKKKGQKQ
jgi:inosine-uridine nucleoside N-ribohydrolase